MEKTIVKVIDAPVKYIGYRFHIAIKQNAVQRLVIARTIESEHLANKRFGNSFDSVCCLFRILYLYIDLRTGEYCKKI